METDPLTVTDTGQSLGGRHRAQHRDPKRKRHVQRGQRYSRGGGRAGEKRAEVWEGVRDRRADKDP